MSRRMKIMVGILIVFVLFAVFFGGFYYGQKKCKPYPQPVVQKEVAKKPQQAAKKTQITKRKIVKQQPEVAKQQVAKQVAPMTQVAVPNFGTTKLILRINVVEWSPVFQGKSLMSRDIGPIVRQGLANGTVALAKETLGFTVNGASVSVQGGHVIVDVGQITLETVLVVQPANGAKFASPPGGLPLTTNPGELDAVVKRGVSEIWMNFILAPPTG